MAYSPVRIPQSKPTTEMFFDLDPNEVVLYLHKIIHAFENVPRFVITNIIIEKIKVQQPDITYRIRYTLTVTYWTHRLTKSLLLNDLKNLPSTPLTREK